VMNFGVSGFGTANEYLLLKEYVIKYAPDMVILAFLTGNDVRNNKGSIQGSRAQPYFELDENDQLKQLPFNPGEHSLFEWILKRSDLAFFVRSKVYKIRATFRKKNQDIPRDLYVYSKDYPQEWESAWEITKRLILEMRNLSEENGARFILLSLTNNEQYIPEAWENLRTAYPNIDDYDWDLEKPEKILAEFSKENEIEFLKLLPYFIEDFKQFGKLHHFEHDGHWNEYGHELAANIIHSYLTRFTHQSSN